MKKILVICRDFYQSFPVIKDGLHGIYEFNFVYTFKDMEEKIVEEKFNAVIIATDIDDERASTKSSDLIRKVESLAPGIPVIHWSMLGKKDTEITENTFLYVKEVNWDRTLSGFMEDPQKTGEILEKIFEK